MDGETLARLLTPVRQIARAAGQAIVAIRKADLCATEKADGSPLTRADTASHQIIAEGLAALRPRLPVVSEEGDLGAAGAQDWASFWCVDPLDGTKEFLKGLAEYTVNIAVVEAGAPVLGVIDVPEGEAAYYAARGLGAWKVQADGEPRPISASRCKRPKTAVVSRSHLSPQTEAFLAGLGITDVVRRGSSLKLCAVAEGAADVYPRHGPTCLWDSAAGAAIALEAGCRIVDLEGAPLSYDPAEGLKRPGFIVYPAACSLSAAR
jgi:3'(2'), 5'-bisphosphate nucleotidase